MVLIVTGITSTLEVIDILFSTNLAPSYSSDIQIFLAAITPLAVWLVPRWRN
jgi:hypothetical protein